MNAGTRAFVALGSNLGDRRASLERAIAALPAAGAAVAAVSAAYENPAVGGPAQPQYWNAVAEVRTRLDPRQLLERLLAIEAAAGRVRGERNGPRVLDLDLLAHGDAALATADATVPHPRALDRAFVLRPWSDVASDAVVPGTGEPVLAHAARLRARTPAAFDALRRVALLRTAGPEHARRPIVLDDARALAGWRARAPSPVGFVPTMGALHEGHASLVRRARAESASVLASLFVNPLQFGPKEDLSRYPRTFERDLELLAHEGVDAVYAPTDGDLYPPGFSTRIDVGGPSAGFEGAARPGHFAGVATVVAKLLTRARPDCTWFGRKDAQQVAMVRRLHADLDLPGALVVGPTVRDLDGLALSSRNRYLSADERRRALAIPAALDAASAAAAGGESSAAVLAAAARTVLDGNGLEVAYLDVVDPATFLPVVDVRGTPALMVVAARAGSTRLLDNEWMLAPVERAS